MSSFATSGSLVRICLIVLTMVISWGCNGLIGWFGIKSTYMPMGLFRSWSWSTIVSLVASSLLWRALWCMISTSDGAFVICLGCLCLDVRSGLWFGVVVAAHLRLILCHLLVITGRVTSSIQLLLISELLLLWWVVLPWGCWLSCGLFVWPTATSSCCCWCSVGTTGLLLYQWIIWRLYHTRVALVDAHIGWKHAVVHVWLSCVAWIWNLILWSNSWSWFTTLWLSYILTLEFAQLLRINWLPLLWTGVSLPTLPKRWWRLNRFHPSTIRSWMWLWTRNLLRSTFGEIVHLWLRQPCLLLILGTQRMSWVRIKLLNRWRLFFNINGILFSTSFFGLRDICLLLSNIRHHHPLTLLLISHLNLWPLFAWITGYILLILFNRR